MKRNMFAAGWLAVLTALLMVSGCVGSTAAPVDTRSTPGPAQVRVAALAKGAIAENLVYPGNVQSLAQVAIVPEVAGRVRRLAVDVGSEVKAGDVVAEIDPSAYEIQLAQAKAAKAAAEARLASMEAGSRAEQIALAEANLKSVQERLAGMEQGGRTEIVAQAEANLKAAEARLAEVRNGPTPEQIAVAEAQVRLAKDNEYYQQQQADAIGRTLQAIPGDPVNRDALKGAQLGVAWEQTQIATAQLEQLKAGATDEQIAQAEAAVAAARQQVEIAKQPFTSHEIGQAQAGVLAAQEQLALAAKPFTTNDLNAARAAVEQARTAVDLAQLQLQKATVTAPVDGVVAQRLSAEGAMAAPSTPIVTLVARDVEVSVNVDEAKLRYLQVGQAATLSVAAYPGETFDAEVTAIAPAFDPRSRTVAVKIRPQRTSKLLDGMFAQVSITAAQKADALLAPAGAVQDRDGKKVAFAVQDGVVKMREVKTGLASGDTVEISEGLVEGDQVVVNPNGGLADGQAVVAYR
ncbi:MAG: efflux RND transporter periplasmic adaptor subunit [Chloroflexota bacterium]